MEKMLQLGLYVTLRAALLFFGCSYMTVGMMALFGKDFAAAFCCVFLSLCFFFGDSLIERKMENGREDNDN